MDADGAGVCALIFCMHRCVILRLVCKDVRACVGVCACIYEYMCELGFVFCVCLSACVCYAYFYSRFYVKGTISLTIRNTKSIGRRGGNPADPPRSARRPPLANVTDTGLPLFVYKYLNVAESVWVCCAT